jgi:hypothetical protein
MNVSSVALGGLHQAEVAIQKAANTIANVAGSLDAVSLSDAAVALMENRNAFAANIQTLKMGDQMDKEAIDLIGR